MRPPRLGPLGAPVAIVGAWVVTRALLLVPGAPPEIMMSEPADIPEIVTTAPTRPTLAVPPASGSDSQQNRDVPSLTPAGGTGRFSDRGGPGLQVATIVEQPSSGATLASTYPATPLSSGIVGGSASAPPVRRRPLTGSAWALVNGTGGAVGVASLGGSQAGVRLFLQGEGAPLALTARVSRALGRLRDTEVSAGYALRGRNVGLLVERRERLDAKDGAFVATAYGGLYDVALPANFRFDGFAQAGVAGLRSRRWFADGQARLTQKVALSDRVTFGAGGGAWASAQRGARRFEAGPLVEARVRVGAAGIRVAGEYRFRLTGDALPRSGPALTVGVDF